MNNQTVRQTDWQFLLEDHGEPCISLFMPVHPSDGQQDPIRYRNLLRDAENRLLEWDLAPDDATGLLAPARAKLEDPEFWRQHAEGLAVFCSPEVFRSYHLHYRLRERVMVGSRFYLRPLSPLLQTRGRFYVLALSLNHVRLLEARRDDVQRLELQGVPGSFDEALGYEQYDSGIQVHSASPPGAGRQTAIFHGHGDADQDRMKKDVLRFFQLVAKGLSGYLRDRQAPLVLATVEEHVPLYRTANTHPILLDEAILGNPEAVTDQQLHERAWALVEPWMLRERDEALQRYVDLKGSGRVSSDLRDVVSAAHQGRVDVLIVTDAPEQWGSYDPRSAQVDLHDKPQEGDEDLLDVATFHTLTHGGKIYTLEAPEGPEAAPAAAIYRY